MAKLSFISCSHSGADLLFVGSKRNSIQFCHCGHLRFGTREHVNGRLHHRLRGQWQFFHRHMYFIQYYEWPMVARPDVHLYAQSYYLLILISRNLQLNIK